MLDQLSDKLPALAPGERKVGETLMQDPQRVLAEPIAALATRAGTSEPTVVRFCRSVGFGGFAEFKVALVDAMREETERGAAGAERRAGADPQDVLGTVITGFSCSAVPDNFQCANSSLPGHLVPVVR